MNDDLLIVGGGFLKALPSGRVSGLGVVFSGPGDPDQQNDFFSINTDFDLRDRRTISLRWEHNLDPSVKGELARATFQMTERGIVIDSQLDLKQRAHRKIYGMVEQGELGLSSGSAGHLVERVPVGKSRWVRSWPISEISLTRDPVERRTYIQALKSLGAVKSLIVDDDDIESQPLEVQQEYWRLKALAARIDHQEAMAVIEGW
jgi:hypothetical protein